MRETTLKHESLVIRAVFDFHENLCHWKKDKNSLTAHGAHKT